MNVTMHPGDCRAVLATLPDASVQCCVSSPPYFGLRSYGIGTENGEIGLEASPDAYVAELVAVFRAVRRVLRDDGTVWLNIGDSYSGSPNSGGANGNGGGPAVRVNGLKSKRGDGIKPKDLLGIPWMVAFALRADGWWLRSDIIWAKPNPMPESVTDRPTSAHEHVFMLSKRASYYWDADAVREELQTDPRENYPARARVTGRGTQGAADARGGDRDKSGGFPPVEGGRNIRNVWSIATQPYSGAHFATMPPALAERCIKAGTKPGDTVLDPFAGAGTTGLVADRLGRNAVLIELNPQYAGLARDRITDDAPLFASVALAEAAD